MTRLAIRNIGIFGKDGSGKTTLTESILFVSGIKKEMGSIAKGTTMADFEEEEQKRKFTLHSAVCNTVWNKETFNLIDTAGYPAFLYDTQSCMKVMDAGLFVFGADSEITTQARYLWKHAYKTNIPIIGVMTFLDKENANFEASVQKLDKRLGKKPVVLQIPYGEKNNFKGIIDLVEGKLYEFQRNQTGKFEVKDIPADYKAKYEDYRMKMLEELSVADEELMMKFLDEMDLTQEETIIALRKSFANGDFFPVVIATGEYVMGVHRLMDLLASMITSETLEITTIAKNGNNEPIKIKSANEGPFTGWVFKTMVDPFLGGVNMMKVMSGTLSPNDEIYNATTETSERLGKLAVVRGKDIVDVEKAYAGDIIALTKMKNTNTGDSLCVNKKNLVIFDKIEKQTPVIQYAITLASKKDEDKLSGVIQKVITSDPTVQLIHDGELKQIILAGQGQIQLQSLLEEIKRKFKIEIQFSTPRVHYRETIKGKAEAQGKYKKQSGGKGQYGDCHIRMKPKPRGEGFQFLDKIVGGSIPRNFIPSVEKGIVEACKKGILKGYQMIDFEVELFFGSYHDVDSSDMAFQIAGSMAFKKATPLANPIILEPYVNMEISVEDDYVGAVAGDISSRRGRVAGFESVEGEQVVKAVIPLIEVMEYEPILNQITSGNARFKMEFSHYEEFKGDIDTITRNGEEIADDEE